MNLSLPARVLIHAAMSAALTLPSVEVAAADKALLDILLGNGVISQAQYDSLMKKEALTSQDILGPAAATSAPPTAGTPVDPVLEAKVDVAVERAVATHLDAAIEQRVVDKVAKKVDSEFPVKASYGSKGFRLATRDGRFETNLQWRAQLRYSYPFTDDPRQLAAFASEEQSTFEARRLRMKIGGFGFQPWIKYYFEVDLEPTRSVDDEAETASGRVIDWRIDIAKFSFAELRVGQWKIDHNRERVDSSGRQQFVERSIVNHSFTIDRQVGVQLRGHLFERTLADMRYWAGVFTGEGRGVENDDDNMMWQGRLQWNFLGRDLEWQQTDVEYTELPTGSLAFGAVTNKGRCTRWSSSGCGNLDGFSNGAAAAIAQYKTEQMVQEFAFKWRGFSVQEEYHWKTVEDRLAGQSFDMQGAYAQVGYFFHHLFPVVPQPLELAFRYAFVDEPNRFNRFLDNNRQEYTVGANWFLSGHDNKVTVDYSHLTLDEVFLSRDANDDRVRVQWDVSF